MDLNGNLKNKNLIAISGKKQSGKNTIAKIINQLTNNKYEEKCFADKLKDIICLLIGCTREQLEDESFKSKELGEEWWYFKGRNGSLISYSEGSKRSDEDLIKTTPRLLLQLLGTECGRQIIHPNLWILSLMNEYKGIINPKEKSDELVNPLDCKAGDIVWHFPYNWELKTLTQKDIDTGIWGTGNGNERFLLSNCYKPLIKYPNWIITDTRFPNEAQAILDKKGILIRVNRYSPSYIKYLDFVKSGKATYEDLNSEQYPMSFDLFNRQSDKFKKRFNVQEHESETALDNYEKFTYVIENNNSIEELIEKVKQILIKEKLL